MSKVYIAEFFTGRNVSSDDATFFRGVYSTRDAVETTRAALFAANPKIFSNGGFDRVTEYELDTNSPADHSRTEYNPGITLRVPATSSNGDLPRSAYDPSVDEMEQEIRDFPGGREAYLELLSLKLALFAIRFTGEGQKERYIAVTLDNAVGLIKFARDSM